jgi:hypothetical protein
MLIRIKGPGMFVCLGGASAGLRRTKDGRRRSGIVK